MRKQITITLDDHAYQQLSRAAGRKPVSQYIEELLRPHVEGRALEEGYRAMAADTEREAEASEWLNALSGDVRDEAR